MRARSSVLRYHSSFISLYSFAVVASRHLRVRLPRASLSSRGEKIFQRCCGIFGQNSRGYFHAMIQLRMIQHRETRAHRAAFGVWSAVN